MSSLGHDRLPKKSNEGVEMKTLKQVADELGIDKQRVARWVRNNVKDVVKKKGANGETVVLDEEQERQVKAHFIVKAERGSKTMPNQSEPVRDVANDLVKLERENAVLNERVRGLEKENALLRERLDQADQALTREQMQSRGFWSRLGQKLLGDGSKK